MAVKDEAQLTTKWLHLRGQGLYKLKKSGEEVRKKRESSRPGVESLRWSSPAIPIRREVIPSYLPFPVFYPIYSSVSSVISISFPFEDYYLFVENP